MKKLVLILLCVSILSISVNAFASQEDVYNRMSEVTSV